MLAEGKLVTACIIDDDKIFTYGFKKFMQLKGIFAEILDFSNGSEAIDYLKSPAFAGKLPDIIFVDINMPIMDGWEFTQNFEEIKSHLGKNIALYAISSSIDLNDISRAKNNPAIIDYILKPIDELSMAGIINTYQPTPGLKNIN
jgi:CheY-like chemotaxis protein